MHRLTAAILTYILPGSVKVYGILLFVADSRVSSNSHTCTRCALKNFKELAYSYRSQIPNNDFPGACTVFLYAES